MSFVHPSWLLLLFTLPVILLIAILRYSASNKAWQKLVAPRLRKQLVSEGSSTRRWASLTLALLGCALLVVVVARPYGGKTSTTEQIRSRNIIIAMDTSRSMLVEDVAPNRMSNAKAMALELIQTFPNDRIGVIAFSGAAVSMAPLTIDHTAVHETIRQLDTDVIPSGGSDLAAAVDMAIKTFEKSDKDSNALIIISDGEDHSEQIQQVGSRIRNAAISVCTIGVGTADGGVIPDLRNLDGKFRDINGNTVYSRLNPGALQQIASAGGGSYVLASSGADNTIRQALSSLESTEEAGRVIDIPNDLYQWFLCPAMILLMLSVLIRSNLFAGRQPQLSGASAVLILLLVGTGNLQAAKVMERALDAYQSHDYNTAMELFTQAKTQARGQEQHVIDFSQGSAAYRLKQWDSASGYFSRALLSKDKRLQEQSHYNLGNSLFQSGWTSLNPEASSDTEEAFLQSMRQLYDNEDQGNAPSNFEPDEEPQLTAEDVQRIKTNWQDAISHYRASLMLNANNTEAEENLEEVEKLLEQLEQAQKQAQQESEQEDNEKKQQDQGDQQDKSQNDQNQSEQDSGQEGENEDQQSSDPKQSDEDQQNQAGDQAESSPEDEQRPEPNPEESKEEFAARILREQSDAEVRPVQRRLMRLRRPEKDW